MAKELKLFQFESVACESSYYLDDTNMVRLEVEKDSHRLKKFAKDEFFDFMLRLAYDVDVNYGYENVSQFWIENRPEIEAAEKFFGNDIIAVLLDEMKIRSENIKKDAERLKKMIQ